MSSTIFNSGTALNDYLQAANYESVLKFSIMSNTEHGDNHNSVDDVCQPFNNSDKWLAGPRLGNMKEELMTDEFVQDMVLHVSPINTQDGSRAVLKQTICMENSRFINWENNLSSPDANDLGEDEKLLQLMFRLIFLAIHENQHQFAREEAMSRLSCKGDQSFQSKLEAAQVGKFDFECPNAKFIVSNVPSHGLGASIRIGLADPLFLGLLSNRVHLTPSSVSVGNAQIRKQWPLASCSRHDLQCFFLPMSPCVITEDELAQAPMVTPEELKKFRESGRLDEKYDNERVIVVGADAGGHKPWPKGLREALHSIIMSMYRQDHTHVADIATYQRPAWAIRNDTLTKVSKILLDSKSNLWMPNQATTFYFLRPNLFYQSKINELMGKIVPSDFDPETAIGIPVRSSDKCLKESECLSFDQYMQIATRVAEKAAETRRGSEAEMIHKHIVLTSESLPILQARFNYTSNASFPFKFVANDADVAQGTGAPGAFRAMSKINITADDIMLSTIMALKMQLLTESTVGNCCSNFHKMMVEFLGNGCGAARRNNFECLQENENPEFRLCCMWSRSKECRQKDRKQHFEKGSDVLHPDVRGK